MNRRELQAGLNCWVNEEGISRDQSQRRNLAAVEVLKVFDSDSEFLDLSQRGLTSTPTELSELTNLVELRLHGNPLINFPDRTLLRLSKLHTLWKDAWRQDNVWKYKIHHNPLSPGFSRIFHGEVYMKSRPVEERFERHVFQPETSIGANNLTAQPSSRAFSDLPSADRPFFTLDQSNFDIIVPRNPSNLGRATDIPTPGSTNPLVGREAQQETPSTPNLLTLARERDAMLMQQVDALGADWERISDISESRISRPPYRSEAGRSERALFQTSPTRSARPPSDHGTLPPSYHPQASNDGETLAQRMDRLEAENAALREQMGRLTMQQSPVSGPSTAYDAWISGMADWRTLPERNPSDDLFDGLNSISVRDETRFSDDLSRASFYTARSTLSGTPTPRTPSVASSGSGTQRGSARSATRLSNSPPLQTYSNGGQAQQRQSGRPASSILAAPSSVASSGRRTALPPYTVEAEQLSEAPSFNTVLPAGHTRGVRGLPLTPPQRQNRSAAYDRWGH